MTASGILASPTKQYKEEAGQLSLETHMKNSQAVTLPLACNTI